MRISDWSSDVCSSDLTDRASLAEYGGDTAACPVAAMKLKKVVEDGTVVSDDEIDETAFDDYIDDLEAKGFTYHDVAMAWGARLISPTGLFASDNAKAEKNDRPLSRHLSLLTDGKKNNPRAK